LDVSGLSLLVNLYCNYNSLTSLSIANLPSLTYLDCGNNLLTSLDFSGTPSLDNLYSEYNLLTSLNVSGLPLLWLDCYNNSITSLDVSGLTSLEGLGCNDNLLTSLDASGLSLLTYFNCDYNLLLTSLNISECPLLIDLSPNGTDSLVYIDASGSGLTSFNPSGSILTYLNLSGCPLTTFVVEGLYDSGVEFLTTLILSGCTLLVDFEASYFPVLNSVDLSGCTALTGSLSLDNVFDGSPIETLSYAGCTGITSFEVDGGIMQQYLKTFNCSGCSALTTLSLYSCDILETVYLTNCSALSNITITNSNISSINLSGLDLLSSLRLNGNSLTSIDISSTVLIDNLELKNTLLSSLNISTLKSTGAVVSCEPSPITSIDATGITVLNMYMRNCSMSSSALNSFFTSLGNADAGAGYSNLILIYGNPGTATCDTTIATAKGWTVDTTTP
jgi:Leucine-rich repeat (LRR) protein